MARCSHAARSIRSSGEAWGGAGVSDIWATLPVRSAESNDLRADDRRRSLADAVHVLVIVVAALYGLCIGSFLNVVGYRVPRQQSVAGGRSHCPGCSSPIAWRDNVPVLGWLALRARCRTCHMRISARYPIGEAAVGLGYGLVAVVTRKPVPFIVGIVAVTVLATAVQIAVGRRQATQSKT